MNQREFAEKLRSGKITNYTKYLKGNKIGYSGFREELARQGLCLDKLAKSHEPGVQQILIENGYAKEQYKTWAREGEPAVMQKLAQYGYCLDILSESTNEKVQCMLIYTKEAKDKWLEWAKTGTYKVREALLQHEECAEILANDPVDEIRAVAVLYYPQYVNCLIGKPGIETFIAMQKVLVEQATPEQEAYDYYMENIERFELDYKQEIKDTDEEVIKRYRKLNKVLAEKYEAMKLPVTTLASTMTWEQLREAGNPLWMANKSAKEIAKLQKN